MSCRVPGIDKRSCKPRALSVNTGQKRVVGVAFLELSGMDTACEDANLKPLEGVLAARWSNDLNRSPFALKLLKRSERLCNDNASRATGSSYLYRASSFSPTCTVNMLRTKRGG